MLSTTHTSCMLVRTVVLCTIEVSCNQERCILDEKCEESWIFLPDRVPLKNRVFWIRSQLPVVACHFQFSMLAVRSRIATSPPSRNDGPLRHIGAGTHGHSGGHRALRCTTPSAASGALLHHFSYGAEQCSTAVRHHRTAQLGHTLLRGQARSFLRPPGFALSGRGRLCGLPFVANYSTYATSPTTPPGRGLGLPRGDIGPLLRRPGLALVRFVLLYIFRGGLVDSRLRKRGSSTIPRTRCS